MVNASSLTTPCETIRELSYDPFQGILAGWRELGRVPRQPSLLSRAILGVNTVDTVGCSSSCRRGHFNFSVQGKGGTIGGRDSMDYGVCSPLRAANKKFSRR
jgi:hypothetical protein